MSFLAELREAVRSCIYRLQDGGYSCTQCDFTSKYQGKVSFNLPLNHGTSPDLDSFCKYADLDEGAYSHQNRLGIG